MTSATDLDALRILASAIAGRAVQVAPAAPGMRTWTDGRTIYLEDDVAGPDRIRLLGVQASLLAADSLRADVIADLRGRRALGERYLAVEGHRALAANEVALPPWMRPMIDHDLAARVSSPRDALDLARRDRTLAPAWTFGAIDPRRTSVPNDAVAAAPQDGRRRTVTQPADLAEMDEEPEGSDDLGNLLNPVGGSGALGRLMAKLLRPSRARDRSGDPGADAPTHLAGRRVRPGRTVRALGPGDVTITADAPAATVRTYPEWDERRQAYRPHWCQVHDALAEPVADAHVDLHDSEAMRRALARLGTEPARCRRQRQGDDLDIDAVVASRVDRIAGGLQHDDVYIDNLRTTRALSVLVLLDVSGSATEPGVGGRTVHEHQRDAAATIVTALHRLGDRVALYAFNSRGRTAVEVLQVKGFADLLDERVSRRLGGLRPGAFTRLGAAIRHATAVLESESGTARRVLLVLSDGFAYDHGYEGRHGEADARRALLEARRRGIGCLCISVGADTDPVALTRVFGTAAHASVPATGWLPSSIGPLFAVALRTADAQRRRFQRTARTRERLHIDSGQR